MNLIKQPTNRGERGQAVLEFAFILPLFLIVLFLVVEFGIGFSRWIVITNSTREAARFAVVQQGSSPDVITAVQQRAIDTSNGLLDVGDVTVNFVDGPDPNDTAGQTGDSVVVSASFDYSLVTPLGAFLTLAFDTLTISACTDMRQELRVESASDDGATQC
jgi:Flp pilus assembly protein TadG